MALKTCCHTFSNLTIQAPSKALRCKVPDEGVSSTPTKTFKTYIQKKRSEMTPFAGKLQMCSHQGVWKHLKTTKESGTQHSADSSRQMKEPCHLSNSSLDGRRFLEICLPTFCFHSLHISNPGTLHQLACNMVNPCHSIVNNCQHGTLHPFQEIHGNSWKLFIALDIQSYHGNRKLGSQVGRKQARLKHVKTTNQIYTLVLYRLPIRSYD